jgi:hypothetical protein
MSADQPPAPPRRRRGEHGAQPLSVATRRRLGADLLRRAEGGDAAAAGELVRLSVEIRRRDAKSGAGEG